MTLNFSYRNVIRILVGSIIGIYILLITLLNIPLVQKRLSHFTASQLSEKLHTQVNIGYIDIGFLNRIIIHDLHIKDQKNGKLLDVSDLSAKFKIAPLLKGKIVISSVQIFNFYLNVSKTDQMSPSNLQFIIDALSSKDNKKESQLDLRINSLLIRNGNLKYDVLSQPQTPEKFNTSHIDISNIAGIVSLKALSNDSLNARVRRLQFTEKSGVNLERFSFRVIGNNKKLSVSNIDLEFPCSGLRFNNIVFRYKSLKNLLAFSDDVSYSGNVNALICPNDFASFIPQMRHFSDRFNLNIRISGNNDKIIFSRFSMTDDIGMEINGEALVNGLKKENTTDVSVTLFNSNITNRNINNIVSSLGITLPPPITERSFINFRGEINGQLNNLALNGAIHSDLGIINTKVIMNTDKAGIRSYSGKVECNKFSLQTLLNDQNFGDADFNVELKEFSYKNRYPESYVIGNINSLDFKGYKYSNITMDGKLKDGGFNGKLNIDDKNCNVDIDGNFNFKNKLPEFNIIARVKDLSPEELNISKKYKDSHFSFNINSNFVGNSIDDIDGTISVDSLTLDAPGDGSFYVDNISVKATHNGDEKNITLSSPFMNGNITGRFKYKTLPASILSSIEKYIPSLIKTTNARTLYNDVSFSLDIENSDFLSKMLFIPIELNKPAHIKGYINDNDNKLRLEASMPRFKYNNTVYDSGVLLFENTGKNLLCNIYGSTLLNSGVMVSMSVNAAAKDDKLTTTLNWGNNSINTYGGKFSTVTSFARSSRNDINARINIQPSQVILNDSIWNIHSSTVDIHEGDVNINNFVFEHDDQHIIINGDLSKNENDSCNIDMKDINLLYLLNIVQFDDVKFAGMITGNVVLKNILNSADMYAKLDVKDFAVNDALLGRADIDAVWDKEKGDIRLVADIRDKDKSTKVTGFVSPKRSDLDLHIKAGGTNISLLTPFVEGIFSEIQGGVYGNIRLFGDFKHIDFEGEAMANVQAKVDVLNTYFRIKNDSIHITPGDFAFRNVHIEDLDGNSGYVTGDLRHNKLKNLTYHFNINGNNLLMYNTQQSGDMPFYGKVYATGNVIIDGGNNAMNVDASIRTAPNTTFTYLTSMPNEATSNQFITFVDRTPKRLQDEIETNVYHPLNKIKEAEEAGPPMDLRINMTINATPDANVKIIMDPIAGDNITATGYGNLQVGYYNKGDFRIFGNYTIDKGLYKLSMQEIIRKDFTLKQGGTVTFNGDPYMANLDVQASYTVNSVSINDLGMGTSGSAGQNTTKVNCLMNLTGSISDPTIKFDLELPNANEEDKQIVRSATRTEEQMNTQIIYLLGIGKFYTYDYANAASTQSSNATSSLALNTLSGQFNNILSQALDIKNWNFGANFSTGEKGWTDVEAEAILSGSLLNNRLLINGNFGYKDNALANTNFIGDFEAIWLLNKDGDWRLRGYSQTNDRYYMKSTLTTQGIGIMYKKDFTKWKDLFKWALWWQHKQKEKNSK